MLKLALVLLSGSALLYACGGGGGSAGTCNASAETCGQQTSGSAVTTGSGTSEPVTPIVLVTDNQLKTITCAQVLALNGGNTNNTVFAAKDAYDRGATQLDSDPNDGIPCNG